MAVVPRVLLDHVREDVAKRDGHAAAVDGVVEGSEGRSDRAGTDALLVPDSERLIHVGVLDVELGGRAVDLARPRRPDILGVQGEAEPASLDGGRVTYQAQKCEP